MSNNTYNKLEDQGWEKMKAMLDAEMPVEGHPKRRAMLWWWTGAASILILIAALMVFDKPDNTDEIASQFSNEAQISTNNSTETTDNQQTENKSSDDSNNVNLKDESLNSITSTNETEKKSSNSTKSNFSPSTNQNASNLPENTLQKRTIASSESTVLENNSQRSESLELTSDHSKPEVLRKEINPIQALNMIQNQGVHLKSSLASNLAIKPSKSQTINWRAQSGILMESFSQIRGWNLGFSGNWNLKSPRWSVQAGLGYARINQPLAYFTATDDNSFQEEKLNGVDSTELGGYINYDISRISGRERISINQSYHFLEIPLRINYKISPKWELYSGVKPSFRFEFPEKNDAEYLSVSADSGSFNNSVYTIPVEFPTFNLHALGGIQYHAGKHFYLWTQWEQNIPTQQRLVSFVNSRLAIGAGFQW